MKLQDLLVKNAVLPDMKAADKKELLTQMANYLCSLYSFKDSSGITQQILQRETEASTGIGFGIAIPHARVEGVEQVSLILGRCLQGVEFDSIDDEPVTILFMITSPRNTSEDHTRVLQAISRVMSVRETREALLQAANAEEILEAIIAGENRL